jgi:hypothetical protein
MTDHVERNLQAKSPGGPAPFGIAKTDVIRVLFVEDDDD